MAQRNGLEQRLQQLLKSRPIPVDEGRLETMRAGLRSRLPRREIEPARGFFYHYRFALSFGTALVLIGLLVWQLPPFQEPTPIQSLESELAGVLEDEEQFTDMLVLFNGFTATRTEEEFLVDLRNTSQSWLGDEEDERLFEALYGWATQPRETEPSALLPQRISRV